MPQQREIGRSAGADDQRNDDAISRFHGHADFHIEWQHGPGDGDLGQARAGAQERARRAWLRMIEMNRNQWIVAAVAALALASCNKNKSESTTVTNEKVTITQANPPPGGTWADVVNATSDGYMMGNPNAKVKLVEIASLGCPFCKKFADEGFPHLVDYVKTGQVSWELRPYLIHGPIDMAADLIVRCNGIKTFFPLVE